MVDKVIRKTKRGDGKYNVLMNVDGVEYMAMGMDAGTNTDHLRRFKILLMSQAKEELVRVEDEIRTWRGQLPDENITQKDIDDRLLELYSKRLVLVGKANVLVINE